MMRCIFESWDEGDEEVLSQMVQVLGKLPESWWSSWEERSRRFDDHGNLKDGHVITVQDLLEDGIQMMVGGEDGRLVDLSVPKEERDVYADLLLRILKYNSKERATVDSVMEHPCSN